MIDRRSFEKQWVESIEDVTIDKSVNGFKSMEGTIEFNRGRSRE